MASQFSIDDNSFNEDRALEHIRSMMPKELNEKTDDDDILCIIDFIWDYYEKKGLLSLDNIDDEEEELLDVKELSRYVRKEAATYDDLLLSARTIDIIIKAELDYEKSLENNL